MKAYKEYYAPSVDREIANGQTEVFEYRGLSGDLYAANRFLVGCDDPAALEAITVTAKTNRGRDVWFEDISLLALQRLFINRSFRGGIVIEENKTLQLEISNNSGNARHVSVTLNGYDAPQYYENREKYEAAGKEYPEAQFAYASGTIAANATRQKITFSLPAADTELHRIAIAGQDDDDLLVTFVVDNKEVFPQRFVDAVNDEFRDKAIIEPVLLQANLQFEAYVTNLNGAASRRISILAEIYKV